MQVQFAMGVVSTVALTEERLLLAGWRLVLFRELPKAKVSMSSKQRLHCLHL